MRAVFQPSIEVRKCRFIWLGTTQPFSAFTFAFERTEHGWFQIHAYQFSKDLSTVIVETREETWAAHGLDKFDTAQSIAFCEQLFARHLGGHSSAKQRGSPAWIRLAEFQSGGCRRWHHGNVVLIGDAAHTAHFSIGSGTKLAMEDAISLVRHVTATQDRDAALERLSEGAPRRSAQTAERRAQPHGMVRERGALCAACRRSSSPTAC